MWASVVVAGGLRGQLSSCGAMGLVALRHVGSSWTRDQTCVCPALAGRFSTTRPPERPSLPVFISRTLLKLAITICSLIVKWLL